MAWSCLALESSSESKTHIHIHKMRVRLKSKDTPDKNYYQQNWNIFIVLRNTFPAARQSHLFSVSLSLPRHRRRLGRPSCGTGFLLVPRLTLISVSSWNTNADARHPLAFCSPSILLDHFFHAPPEPPLTSNEMCSPNRRMTIFIFMWRRKPILFDTRGTNASDAYGINAFSLHISCLQSLYTINGAFILSAAGEFFSFRVSARMCISFIVYSSCSLETHLRATW